MMGKLEEAVEEGIIPRVVVGGEREEEGREKRKRGGGRREEKGGGGEEKEWRHVYCMREKGRREGKKEK